MDGNPYPDDSPVQVRFPLDDGQPREQWPWLPGIVLEQCGPDEWHVCVEAREVATLDDGSPAPDGIPDVDVFFPCCFRDSSELRPT